MSTPGLSHLSWLSTSPAAIEANQNSQTRTQTGQKNRKNHPSGRLSYAILASVGKGTPDQSGQARVTSIMQAAARERRRQGGQQRTGVEKAARAGEVGKCSSSGVQRGVLDHPKENTSVQERQAPEQHPQHGGEGRTPHRAEAFVAMRRSVERKQGATTVQTTGHGNRAVVRYNQIPGGRDQQKLTGPERHKGTTGGAGGRGGTLPEEGAKQSPQQDEARQDNGENSSTTSTQQHRQSKKKRREKRHPHQQQQEKQGRRSRQCHNGPNGGADPPKRECTDAANGGANRWAPPC